MSANPTIQNKSNNALKKSKNDGMKNFGVDIVTNFIEDEVKRSSGAEVYTDDNSDSEEDKVIGFR